MVGNGSMSRRPHVDMDVFSAQGTRSLKCVLSSSLLDAILGEEVVLVPFYDIVP
jgi:hypothetical protein